MRKRKIKLPKIELTRIVACEKYDLIHESYIRYCIADLLCEDDAKKYFDLSKDELEFVNSFEDLFEETVYNEQVNSFIDLLIKDCCDYYDSILDKSKYTPLLESHKFSIPITGPGLLNFLVN
jgi:hypothetical protein